MIRSYFKIAFRNLAKNRIFSVVNIVGLAIGTTCCLYIMMYVMDQYSYDKQHDQAASIYRVNSEFVIQGTKSNIATSSPPIAPTMKNDFAEVAQFTRVVPTDKFGVTQHLLRYQEKSLYEKDAVYVDSTFFDVFTYHFVYGNALKVLAAPYTIVLLKPTAEKLFGNTDPVGKVIEMDDAYGKQNFTVTGVVDESLGKSHIQASMFMAMNSGGMGSYTYSNDAWAAYNYAASYVKLKPNTNVAALSSKLPAFLERHGAQQLKEMGMEKQLSLQNIRTIHTTSTYKNELSKTVDSAFLKMLLLIAALIQIIACINFMNLATARASKRAKEVGVRKVIGAGVNDLVMQFLGESFLLSLLGVVVALPVLTIALPYLNQLTEASINLSFLTDYRLWLALAGIIVFTGLFAGSYPAFYLSAFKPVSVIKGNFNSHISAAGIRRFLVVFQFALSIIFISGIIVIYNQLNFIKNKDLGFEKGQRIIFNFHTDDTKAKMTAFMSDLRVLPEVKVVSRTENYPSQMIARSWLYYPEGGNVGTGKDLPFIFTDQYFVKAMGIQLVSGRDFNASDSGRVLINEAGAKAMGLNLQTAVGKRLYAKDSEEDPVTFVEIAGVMKDFNYNSLHDDIKPLMLRFNPAFASNHIVLSAESQNYSALLKKIDAVWQKSFPSTPFEYSFLDAEMQKQYETEATLSGIINSFTGIAIFISVLGLFGLSTFSTEQRNKEIGIRKVLGADLMGLVYLLSKDFLKLVGIAFIIAAPVAWWAMSKWLEAFAYRISLNWWMFAVAGAIAMLVALCTVSFQAIKGAVANPLRSLKME